MAYLRYARLAWKQMQGKRQIRIGAASSEDRERIRLELASVLAREHFTSSKRYPAFLSHVVQKTLEGRTDELKERSIGISVFSRKPDFDTSSDTVVRFTAGEVRKRLNSIYLDDQTHSDVQIVLPVGSYIPDFFFVDGSDVVVDNPELPTPEISPVAVEIHGQSKPLFHWSTWWLWIGCLAFVICGIAAFLVVRKPDSVDRFWQPVRSSHSASILAAGAFVFSRTSPTGRAPAEAADAYPYMSVATTASIGQLALLYGRMHMEYLLQPSVSTTLTEMGNHPTVLVGAYDNDWTLRLVNELRFRFSARPGVAIYDSKNPSVSWTRPKLMPAYEDADDYAIVARFEDRLTENTVVVIAGLGQNGTAAATQFVTSARYLDLLNQPRSRDWAEKNVEVVLKVAVIGGKTGPPTIEAVEVW